MVKGNEYEVAISIWMIVRVKIGSRRTGRRMHV